jgi:UDP-N-acetylglucosamine 2-epimerase (non-hydrolysing)
MKVMTILGTRPEIIRLSRIIPRLDDLCEHVLVHTGQNFDPNLDEIFFRELRVRKPNYNLGIRAETFGEQIGKILAECERALQKEKPDRLLLLGDTNSSLSAIVAKRLGISVYHLEAGNRCYDDRVPEEVNRRIIDHTSDVLMPYTERSRANLLREGVPGERIYVVGNPIFEVINHYSPEIAESAVLSRLKLTKNKYFLVTMHRAENVDIESRLRRLVGTLAAAGKEFGMPVICSVHPRTADRMRASGINFEKAVHLVHEPFGFYDFVALEQSAFCVLTDSGTVQEECCIFYVPNVTIRDVTERPETVECGSNIIAGAERETVTRAIRVAVGGNRNWSPPREYLVPDVSTTATKIVLGERYPPVA